MLRRVLVAGLLAVATVPFTSTPASAICTIFVPTGELTTFLPDVGPYNCNFCPAVERVVEKQIGDKLNCWT